MNLEKPKYWIHRISHEWDVSYKLLENGYLSIGWSNLADSGIEKIDIDNTKQFEDIFISKYSKKKSRWSLWKFLNFSVGDYVVVPMFYGEFSIYKIVGNSIPVTKFINFESFESKNGNQIIRNEERLFCRKDKDEKIEKVDLGFVAKVDVVKDKLSRYEYADSKLTSRMKFQGTTTEITDLKESIDAVIKATKPINFYSTVIEELSRQLLKTIKEQLGSDKLESLIKWYFERLGASRTQVLPKNSSDKIERADADIVAEFDTLKVAFYIQAKFHDGETNQWAVEQISKYKEQHERNGDGYTIIPWVVSTADRFSEDAINKAQENNVCLISGLEFCRMIIDAGITNINGAF